MSDTVKKRDIEREIVESTGNRLVRMGLTAIAISTLVISTLFMVGGIAFGEFSGAMISVAGTAAALFVLRSLAKVTAVTSDGIRVQRGRNEEVIRASDIRYVFKTPRYTWSERFGLYIAVRHKAT